jgi:hypothetical protein
MVTPGATTALVCSAFAVGLFLGIATGLGWQSGQHETAQAAQVDTCRQELDVCSTQLEMWQRTGKQCNGYLKECSSVLSGCEELAANCVDEIIQTKGNARR